jgi:uncharacterized protein
LMMLEAMWRVMLELAPWFLLGTVIASAMHALLPGDFVRRKFRGKWGVIKAVALGVPLPLCSCGVIPAGLGLKKDGASDGASVGFLISTPQTGVDSVLVAAAFLGWPFAIFKVFGALITGLVGGFLADRLPGRESEAGQSDGTQTRSEARPGMKATIEHGLELIRMIWGWLLIGVILSAGIEVLLPQTLFAQLAGENTWIAFGMALVISIPLYVCATASVPIAASLVAAGMPTGAALVFLMAGPATNVATIGALYRGFGKWIVSIYLGTIIVGSILFGLCFDFLLEPAATSPAMAHAHQHGSWWQFLSATLLMALLAWFAFQDLSSWLRKRGATPTQGQALEVLVTGMTCGGCVKKLERVVMTSNDVEEAVAALEPGHISVRGNIAESDLRSLIRQAGFKPLP